MAKIVLSPAAPDNQPLAATFGSVSFDAGKAQSFETDDATLLAEAQRHPFFEVEGFGDGTISAADAKSIRADDKRLADAREAWVKEVESLQPWDSRPLEPRTLADLEETKEQAPDAAAPAASKTDDDPKAGKN